MDDATWEKMKEQWWLGATTKKRMEASLRAKGFIAFLKDDAVYVGPDRDNAARFDAIFGLMMQEVRNQLVSEAKGKKDKKEMTDWFNAVVDAAVPDLEDHAEQTKQAMVRIRAKSLN